MREKWKNKKNYNTHTEKKVSTKGKKETQNRQQQQKLDWKLFIFLWKSCGVV